MRYKRLDSWRRLGRGATTPAPVWVPLSLCPQYNRQTISTTPQPNRYLSEGEPDTMTARYIALDLEATSINPLLAVPLEVAAVEIRESGKYEDRGTEPRSVYVVPHIEHEDLLAAEYGALRVSRYFERGLAERRSCESDTYDAARRLAELLDGAHIVAANPHYDATVLARWFDRLGLEPRWQFRLVDVEVLTMLAHNLPTPPSLRESALRWGVDYDPNKAHSAMYDAELAAAVFTEARVWGAMMDTPASDQAGADAA